MQNYIDFEKILKEQEMQFEKLINMMAKIIEKGKELLTMIKNRNRNNNDNANDNKKYFESLRKVFSQYYENINIIYDSNSKDRIIDGISKIREKINYFNRSNNPIESLEIPFDKEEKIEMTDLFNRVNEFSDYRQKEGLNEIIERTKRNINFYYEFSISSFEKINFDISNVDNLNVLILENITKNKDSLIISSGNEKIYLHNAIKTDKFFNENDKVINDIEDINEIKQIINHFIRREKFNFKGNAKIFNSSQNAKRGTEIYDPPYGFTAIGINVIGIYENDEWLTDKSRYSKWANAYHPIFEEYSIRNIIEEGIKPGKSQEFFGKKDIRHPERKIPKGIYLYPKIKTAEDKAKTIFFNNKKYKFVLMARAKISGICEPENVPYWILREQDVRVYRLLYKEI